MPYELRTPDGARPLVPGQPFEVYNPGLDDVLTYGWDTIVHGSPKDLAKLGVVEVADPPPDMPTLRQSAFTTAMAAGNAITDRVLARYSDVEARSFTLQRTQADTVIGGGELLPDALLLRLAEQRGVSKEAMATVVQAKAQEYERIVALAQTLRTNAEGLLSDTLDTPKKLENAVAKLRAQADAAVSEAGIA